MLLPYVCLCFCMSEVIYSFVFALLMLFLCENYVGSMVV